MQEWGGEASRSWLAGLPDVFRFTLPSLGKPVMVARKRQSALCLNWFLMSRTFPLPFSLPVLVQYELILKMWFHYSTQLLECSRNQWKWCAVCVTWNQFSGYFKTTGRLCPYQDVYHGYIWIFKACLQMVKIGKNIRVSQTRLCTKHFLSCFCLRNKHNHSIYVRLTLSLTYD